MTAAQPLITRVGPRCQVVKHVIVVLIRLTSARIEPPPPDPVLDRPCVLIWTDENHKVTAGQRFLALLGETKEAHATKDVTVDWAGPLIGTQRQSVWHILRGEAVEKARRRVAARGVL